MGFGDSFPQIYTKMQYGGAIQKWNTRDWYSILEPLRSAGFAWDPTTMTMQQMGVKHIASNTPWVHCRGAASKRCQLDHNILFNIYGIIPKRCLECWKVVVTPKSFKELLQLEWLEKKLDVPSKCGIEMRDYTPKFYGGYFYNDSIEEGRECYDKVKDAVRENISEETAEGVILKRGCTEYEMIKGPSPFWHLTKEQEDFCRDITHFIKYEHSNHNQPDLIKNHVHMKWVLWAHMNGDMSYKEFNGDKELFPDYVRYNEGDIEDIKRDLAVAQAQAKAGVSFEDSSEFITKTFEWAAKKKIHPQHLTTILGADDSNPLEWGSVLKQVPQEAKGEIDELS